MSTNVAVKAAMAQDSICQNRCTIGDSRLGDANCDGIINGLDFSFWRYEAIDGVKNVVNGQSIWSADFDCSGIVNIVDFSIWRKGSFDVIVPIPSGMPAYKISFDFDQEDVSLITSENLNKWRERLELAYSSYYELTGWAPYDGWPITIKSYSCIESSTWWSESVGACKYWAWAGQTIGWAKAYVKGELQKINNYDDWSFGILHEISHDFDKDGWNFDGEMMANFKMAYLLEKYNGKIEQNNIYYTGVDVMNYYKIANKGYNYAIANNVYTGDFITYVFLRIKDQIGGWETYKQIFRNVSTKSFNSNQERLAGFINEINSISGINVNNLLSDQEKSVIATFK